jgi:hypothetical protein
MAKARFLGIAALALSAGLVFCAVPGNAAAQSGTQGAVGAQASDPSARKPPRIRPRVRVYPPEPSAWPYPRPGTYSWPGPNAVRECRSWLEPEARLSGTVIVPRMRCWWVPG